MLTYRVSGWGKQTSHLQPILYKPCADSVRDMLVTELRVLWPLLC